MPRRVFFWIVVVIGLLFSTAMLLVPARFAANSGLSSAPETLFLFRALGSMILSVTLANFLVRNAEDSPSLAAILWMNIAIHALATGVDLVGAFQGLITLAHFAPGLVVHGLVVFGAAYYLRKMA